MQEGGMRYQVGIVAALLTARALAAQTPRFEVVSIKQCEPGAASAGRGGSGRAASPASPVRLSLSCLTVQQMIRMAYVQFANGKRQFPGGQEVPISGGPAWISSERYDIEAKAENPESPEMMRGPMAQMLLEERFRLKIHRETKDVPVYVLALGTGVPKLQPAQEGKCVPSDKSVSAEQRQAGLLHCGVFAPSTKNDGSVMYGTTLPNFCAQISLLLDRPVIDKTGIAGVFDIHVDAPQSEPDAPATAPSAGLPGALVLKAHSTTDAIGSAIISAIQKVGLRLESAKGPGEFLFIDHVEKPVAN
jgi:uncharacterized protein (TIGR03435 family)